MASKRTSSPSRKPTSTRSAPALAPDGRPILTTAEAEAALHLQRIAGSIWVWRAVDRHLEPALVALAAVTGFALKVHPRASVVFVGYCIGPSGAARPLAAMSETEGAMIRACDTVEPAWLGCSLVRSIANGEAVIEPNRESEEAWATFALARSLAPHFALTRPEAKAGSWPQQFGAVLCPHLGRRAIELARAEGWAGRAHLDGDTGVTGVFTWQPAGLALVAIAAATRTGAASCDHGEGAGCKDAPTNHVLERLMREALKAGRTAEMAPIGGWPKASGTKRAPGSPSSGYVARASAAVAS